jgi:hypothetical protein
VNCQDLFEAISSELEFGEEYYEKGGEILMTNDH